ncbi:MAG: hypothetical protein JWM36_1647 [Hyphomicrobiales bacterium]|nr:hypothetical protein [Hyphomicrobiales bacterium]
MSYDTRDYIPNGGVLVWTKCLFLVLAILALPAAPATAAEIDAAHRGTWTESGLCSDGRKIVVSNQTVSLVQPGQIRVLTDGDESVFKGETVLNASLPAKNQEEPELGFSARMVEASGGVTLVTDGTGADKAFAGTFKKCTSDTTVAAAQTRRSKTRAALHASTYRTAMGKQKSGRALPLQTVLGGLY